MTEQPITIDTTFLPPLEARTKSTIKMDSIAYFDIATIDGKLYKDKAHDSSGDTLGKSHVTHYTTAGQK